MSDIREVNLVHTEDDELTRTLILILMTPLDPDAPNRSCIRGPGE